MNNLRNKFKEDFSKLKDLPDYERAEIIAEEMFKNVYDKEGKPYINHLRFVSEQLETEEGKIVGLLHDLIEDTDTTLLELQEVGFKDRILYALVLLTKVKGTPYSEYIDKILFSNDEIAIRVKEADMRNNMDPRRLNNLPEDKAEYFIQKYTEPYNKLKNKIGEMENDRHKVNTRK